MTSTSNIQNFKYEMLAKLCPTWVNFGALIPFRPLVFHQSNPLLTQNQFSRNTIRFVYMMTKKDEEVWSLWRNSRKSLKISKNNSTWEKAVSQTLGRYSFYSEKFQWKGKKTTGFSIQMESPPCRRSPLPSLLVFFFSYINCNRLFFASEPIY